MTKKKKSGSKKPKLNKKSVRKLDEGELNEAKGGAINLGGGTKQYTITCASICECGPIVYTQHNQSLRRR